MSCRTRRCRGNPAQGMPSAGRREGIGPGAPGALQERRVRRHQEVRARLPWRAANGHLTNPGIIVPRCGLKDERLTRDARGPATPLHSGTMNHSYRSGSPPATCDGASR